MKIYNTMSGREEEFVPLQEGRVTIYVCGPTVYDLIHIGNARPMVVFDTFRRYLEYKGYEVDYVSNFTDVDDKIIRRANEEGVEASAISERYIEECKKDMEALNVKPATVHPQATQEIGSMIEMIGTLIDKGYAYAAADGTVYYRTRAFAEYGKLSHRNLDDLEGGHREIQVKGEEGKEDPLDFVLWKPKKEGEPAWPSPWGEGRPGWHIECSCMSRRYLGDTIDIHAGGEDLIFPHHENEIAQSEAANGVPFARYWMHNAFLNIESKKMSKSLGNFFTVRDILKKYDPMVLRFFLLQAHYRSPLNFSDPLMDAASRSLERIKTAISNLAFELPKAQEGEATPEQKEEIQSFVGKFEAAMDDDNNTADAISAVFELVRYLNQAPAPRSKGFLTEVQEALARLTGVLGLALAPVEEEGDQEIEALIAERQEARKRKDFQRADEVREELLRRGVVLEDTREGVRWHRTGTER